MRSLCFCSSLTKTVLLLGSAWKLYMEFASVLPSVEVAYPARTLSATKPPTHTDPVWPQFRTMAASSSRRSGLVALALVAVAVQWFILPATDFVIGATGLTRTLMILLFDQQEASFT